MSGTDPLKAETEHKSVTDSSLFSDLMAHLAIPDDSTGVSACSARVHEYTYTYTGICTLPSWENGCCCS